MTRTEWTWLALIVGYTLAVVVFTLASMMAVFAVWHIAATPEAATLLIATHAMNTPDSARI